MKKKTKKKVPSKTPKKRVIKKQPKKSKATKKKTTTKKKQAVKIKKNIIKKEHYFYLSNGKAIKTISELKRVLKIMDEPTFYHHVTEHKSDFAAWVFHVFKDKKLAEKIGRIKTKEELIKAL